MEQTAATSAHAQKMQSAIHGQDTVFVNLVSMETTVNKVGIASKGYLIDECYCCCCWSVVHLFNWPCSRSVGWLTCWLAS